MSYYEYVDASIDYDVELLKEKAEKVKNVQSLPDSRRAIKDFRAFLLLLHQKYAVAEEETAP